MGKNEIWRSLVTIATVIVASLLGNIPLVLFLASSDPVRQRGLDVNDFTPEALGVDPTLFLFLLLFPFVVGLLALWICVRKVHLRDPKRMIQGRSTTIRWNRVRLAFLIWTGLTFLSEAVTYGLSPSTYAFTFSAWAFAKTLVVVVLMIPLQIAFEEILMRGYLLQQIVHYTRRPWVALLVTSLIFGALHFQNPEVQKFGLAATAPYYLGVGFFLGMLTLLDDGLELALGIHMATNIFGALFVNFKGSALPTASLFEVSEFDVPLMTVLFVIQAIVFFLLFRRWFSGRAHSAEKWNYSSFLSKALTD